MPKKMTDDQFLEYVAQQSEPESQAPSRLKSRIYSALIRRQAESGPLQSLPDCKAAGHALCVFEELVRIAPVGEAARRMNPCAVCHARVLAETFENPPIYWPNCPYVSFKKA